MDVFIACYVLAVRARKGDKKVQVLKHSNSKFYHQNVCVIYFQAIWKGSMHLPCLASACQWPSSLAVEVAPTPMLTPHSHPCPLTHAMRVCCDHLLHLPALFLRPHPRSRPHWNIFCYTHACRTHACTPCPHSQPNPFLHSCLQKMKLDLPDPPPLLHPPSLRGYVTQVCKQMRWPSLSRVAYATAACRNTGAE